MMTISSKLLKYPSTMPTILKKILAFTSILAVSALPLSATQANANRFAIRMAENLGEAGYTFDGVTSGFLDDRTYRIVRFYVDARLDYAAYVTGDEDTRDIDLFIYDPNGDLVTYDEDYKPSDFGQYTTDVALCRWSPSISGVYYAKIKMMDSRDVGSYYRFVTGAKVPN